MKKVILLAIFLPYLANGQVIENFESASLANWVQGSEGHWSADTVKSISGTYSLHHIFDNSLSGSDCIGISIRNLHPDEGLTRWTFLVRHGCDPSASNNWCAYLLSDTDPAALSDGAVLNGYAAGVNLAGYDDTLRLWKIKNGALSVIATCPVNWQNDIGTADAAKLIVERSITGYWRVEVYNKQDILKGSSKGFDNELFSSSFFTLSYRYTSTRDRLLWFDDLKIEGVFHDDDQPPRLVNCIISGANSLDLTLDEDPSDDFMLLSNFSLSGSQNSPAEIVRNNSKSFRLTFSNRFTNKILNNLIIDRLCDRSGNCIEKINAGFTLICPDPGDVIITEIMADPLPAVSLPPKEYLEIKNNSRFKFNLKKWSLSTESQSTSFPDVDINAGEYIILCAAADTSA
ncbi:MAG: lamin tail domain-containing protein, partial [Bacteroidales bacterium]